MERTYEYCPHCDTEVELDAELKVQVCPNCGRHIVTCSMCMACDRDSDYCRKCCLCYEAEKLNTLDDIAREIRDGNARPEIFIG